MCLCVCNEQISLGEAIENYKILDILGGVSGTAKLFIEFKYGHVIGGGGRGEGSRRSSSKIIFLQKVCFF